MNDTKLAELAGIQSGSMSPRIFTDPDIYKIEVERIFGKSWLYLGHESQIRKPGDFVATYMVEDPVVLVRQKDGSLAAFLNQCRHRGMRVCRADTGTTRAFSCPYHGWTYGIDGSLQAVPHPEQYDDLDKSQWGLREVPRVESYKGLVFGNWDKAAISLQEYLGPACYYLDGMIDRLEGGSEVLGGAHKWVIDCNWKMPAEQFASDMYHAAYSHISAIEVVKPDNYQSEIHSMADREGLQYWTDQGHAGGYFSAESPNPSMWLEPAANQWLSDTFEEARARLGNHAAARVSGHNTVFPNFSWINGTNTIRIWHPRGPNRIEVWAWTIVDTAAPPEVKDAFRRGALRSFGPSGMLEQDDGENWVEIQKILRGSQSVDGKFCYGMAMKKPDIEFPGPGTHHGPLFSDKAARNFYRRWLELMGPDTLVRAHHSGRPA